MLADVVAVFAAERRHPAAATAIARGGERVDGLAVNRDHREGEAFLPGVALLAAAIDLPGLLVVVSELDALRRDKAFDERAHDLFDRAVVLPPDPPVHQSGHDRDQLLLRTRLAIAADQPVALGELQE